MFSGITQVWFSNQNIWLDFYAFFIGVFVAPGIGGVLALLTDVNGSPDIKIPSSNKTPLCLYTSGIPSCTQLTPGHVMSDLVQNHR